MDKRNMLFQVPLSKTFVLTECILFMNTGKLKLHLLELLLLKVWRSFFLFWIKVSFLFDICFTGISTLSIGDLLVISWTFTRERDLLSFFIISNNLFLLLQVYEGKSYQSVNISKHQWCETCGFLNTTKLGKSIFDLQTALFGSLQWDIKDHSWLKPSFKSVPNFILKLLG